jgi:hypothetical protein
MSWSEMHTKITGAVGPANIVASVLICEHDAQVWSGCWAASQQASQVSDSGVS